MKRIFLTLLAASIGQAAYADAPDIIDTSFTQTNDRWHISVTLEHPDTGWDHYADAWQVLDDDGNVLAERILAHPHVNEQPFTRSTTSMNIPDGMKTVYIRAKCSRDGWTGPLVKVALPDQS